MSEQNAIRFSGLVLAGFILSAQPAWAEGFSLSSPGLADGGRLPFAQVMNGFGCQGGNQSPELVWSDPPAGAKSFAVTVYDPDAPTGSGWWHWLVFNIPATTDRLAAGAGGGELPAGTRQGRNDYGFAGYGGACPPPGKAHRYQFTVYALKLERLDLPADASGAMIGYMLRANSLGHAGFTVLYGR